MNRTLVNCNCTSVGTVGQNWSNITWNVHDLTGSGSYGFFVDQLILMVILLLVTSHHPGIQTIRETLLIPLAYNTSTSNTYAWQGSTVHGPSWQTPIILDQEQLSGQTPRGKFTLPPLAAPPTIVGPTMWPAPYSYPANRLALPRHVGVVWDR